MRVGVLDIGSNTGHLLVVDAHGGAAPLPAYSFKQPLRLAEHLDKGGNVSQSGVTALTEFTAEALVVAEEKGCEDILGFATSAVRDAGNSDDVLEHVHERTGVVIDVLSGEDEARLTFLAVRRWFGWSAGRLAVFDIGGGSLEIAGGPDEAFRSLARICGAPPAAEGALVPRTLELGDLRDWIPKLVAMTPDELAGLPGVSPSRSHQIVPGALVAEACMDIFDLAELEICPWALREGVILERLDQLSVLLP
jgi:exopolyphosphatase/guanosine-5'-triphosphate,3'-diphosphate pyrophosphatase